LKVITDLTELFALSINTITQSSNKALMLPHASAKNSR